MIDYRHLPSVFVKENANLPNTKGVYFVASDDTLLYIGKAESGFKKRWSSHHKFNLFEKYENARIYYYSCDDNIKQLESDLILCLSPCLNRTSTSSNLDNRRRLQINLPLTVKIKIYLQSRVQGMSKTSLIEQILIQRLGLFSRSNFFNPTNWDEVVKDLKMEAAIARQSLQEYVCVLLSEDAEFSELPLKEIDWLPLLETKRDSFVRELIQMLESGQTEEAIALLKQLSNVSE